MSKKNALISVIVPCHNSEKYVVKCIESVTSQSYKNWELLLVDDASSDNSKAICTSFAETDCRIQSITCEGRGVSSARNSGLQAAKGEYVTFVDSDDWLETGALRIMLDEIKDKDFLSASYQRVLSDNQAEKRIVRNMALTQNEYIVELFNSNRVYQGYCWGKLYKMSIIRDNGISFSSELSYNEDRVFVLKYVLKCDRIITSEALTYNYRIHTESAMGKTTYDEEKFLKNIHDELYTARYMLNILENNEEAKAWLKYNLLIKACGWKHQVKKEMLIYSEIISVIKTYAVQILFSRNIRIKNRVKLLKSVLSI